MKCYLILVLLLLSIYIKSDNPPCEQITPVNPTDCENVVSTKKYCCSLIDKNTKSHECKEKSQQEVDQINREEISYKCYRTGADDSSPQTPTSSKDSSRSRASSSSFYLEVGVLISIFLLF